MTYSCRSAAPCSHKFLVVASTGFVPYFLCGWDGAEPHLLPRTDLAKRFTSREARRIVEMLNARNPQAVNLYVTQIASPV